MRDTDTPPANPQARLSKAMLWIASAALIGMMLVVVADVGLRALFNRPVRGAYDMVSITLLVMVAFGTAPVLVQRSEIVIDLIDGLVGRGGVRILGTIAALMTGAMVLFIVWSSVNPAQDAWRWGDRSLELGVPQWALWSVAILGLFAILWGAIVQILHHLNIKAGSGK
ncbi:MAG: TRAP transporter small permease [Pararhodobacter sp.]